MPTALATDKRLIPNAGMGQIISGAGGDKLTAVLGSCVGVAIHHPRLRVGALAHVVLPRADGRSGTAGKFADTAVPELIRLLVAEGAPAAGFVAKLAGGANMFGTAPGPMQIGEANAEALKQLLKESKIRLAGEHLGGNKGRRVTFDCETGTLTVEIVGSEPVVI